MDRCSLGWEVSIATLYDLEQALAGLGEGELERLITEDLIGMRFANSGKNVGTESAETYEPAEEFGIQDS